MYALKQNRYFTDIFYVYMPVPRGGGIYSNKTMFINVLVKWFKKTKVHMLSIKLSISKFQIVKPSDVLF